MLLLPEASHHKVLHRRIELKYVAIPFLKLFKLCSCVKIIRKKILACLLIHLDYRLSPFSDANPFHRHVEILLNKSHVVLSVFWQIAEVPDVGGRCLPAWKRHVLDFDMRQVGDGAGEVVNHLALKLVAKKELKSVPETPPTIVQLTSQQF